MTSRGLAEVLLKLSGVYWLVRAVVALPFLGQMVAAPGWTLALTPMLTILAYGGLGISLIACAGALARRLVAAETGEEPTLSGVRAQAIGLSLLGLYVACDGASSLAGNAATLLQQNPGAAAVNRTLYGGDTASMVANAVYLLAGLALFFGSGAIARFWHRAAARRGDRA